MKNDLEIVSDIKAELGEGPVWDYRKNILYWIDIIGKKIFIYDSYKKNTISIKLNQHIGSLALCKTDKLLLALQNGFYFFNKEKNILKKIDDPEHGLPKNRFNDGKCDASGRFWSGTTSSDEIDPVGSLYYLDDSLKSKKIFNKVIISNGITWSMDNKKMYYIDSPRREVYSFDYSINTAEIKNKKVLIKVPEKLGYPDGMTIDIGGDLWIAHWGSYFICRWDSKKGKLIDKIKIPVKRVSCCTFGGGNLDELYITTAQRGFPEIGKPLDKNSVTPYDGLLFKITTDTKGLGTYLFNS